MTDKWEGCAALLANLIEKYVAVLDIDNLPEPLNYLEEKSNSKESADVIEKKKFA